MFGVVESNNFRFIYGSDFHSQGILRALLHVAPSAAKMLISVQC